MKLLININEMNKYKSRELLPLECLHCKSIFGADKLNQTQNNDRRKFESCLEKNIDLYIIDVSDLKYFKSDKVKKYLDIISKVIDNKLLDISFAANLTA
jgi:hypothetical protein